MISIRLIPRNEFKRIRESDLPIHEKFTLIADMCRANALTAIKIAGSGHIGSSFSAMDIVVYLYYSEMNTIELGLNHPDRDIYFSSKGHDVPGLYSVLHSLGVLDSEKLLKLRRLGGLDGHPDVNIPGIECNSGSLGMGVSKAKGMALAKRLSGRKGRVFVLTGDGEFQEGQVFEALQSALNQDVNNLIAIIDHNKVQSDKEISEIVDLGDLESKLKDFGWYVRRCCGHSFDELREVMDDFRGVKNLPKILIADTIKGRGISFMEHPKAIKDANGVYPWHAGAPDDATFNKGYQEITERINRLLSKTKLSLLRFEESLAEGKVKSGVTPEYIVDAFGSALVELAGYHEEIVVLDADLAADCRLRRFEEKYPNRFIESGIAEQDMVSVAGALALQGFLPIVNSFAAFLASRANEQIYTNACEGTKIIYICHYAGLIPAGPGKSHQSVRDISLFGALPNIEMIQPCNSAETIMALNYCVKEARNSCVLRLIIGPCPRSIELPKSYSFEPGKGTILKDGEDGVLFSYGAVMINEALVAFEFLAEKGITLRVINMPWLNKVDNTWVKTVISGRSRIFVLEDHSPVGGLGDQLIRTLTEEDLIKTREFHCFGVTGFPVCGTPPEALRYHRLDGKSISERVLRLIGG